MSPEIIVFDIDSTLTESKQAISAEMATLLSQLLTRYKVAIISGANYKQFEWQILSKFEKTPDLSKLYLLPADGTVLCQYQDGWKCEADEELKTEEKEKIRDAFKVALQKAGIEQPAQIYGDQVEDRGSQMNFSFFGNSTDAPHDIKRDWDPDNKKRALIAAELKGLLPGFDFHIGGTTSIEVAREGIDKAYGLKKLAQFTAITLDKMLYIGDKLFEGGNDYPVIGLGVKYEEVSGPEETKMVIQKLLT